MLKVFLILTVLIRTLDLENELNVLVVCHVLSTFSNLRLTHQLQNINEVALKTANQLKPWIRRLVAHIGQEDPVSFFQPNSSLQ